QLDVVDSPRRSILAGDPRETWNGRRDRTIPSEVLAVPRQVVDALLLLFEPPFTRRVERGERLDVREVARIGLEDRLVAQLHDAGRGVDRVDAAVRLDPARHQREIGGQREVEPRAVLRRETDRRDALVPRLRGIARDEALDSEVARVGKPGAHAAA